MTGPSSSSRLRTRHLHTAKSLFFPSKKSSIGSVEPIMNRASTDTNIHLHKDNTPAPTLLDKSIPLQEQLSQIVNNVLHDEVKVDFAAEQQKLEDLQRQQFGKFLKKPFVFNPTPPMGRQFDLRFMPKHFNDQVYEQFEQWAVDPVYRIHALRAIPGAGKTAVMLNAVGRNTYLIYVMCDQHEIISTDYRDSSFVAFLTSGAMQRAIAESDVKKSTERIIELLQLFWLARLMTLDYIKQTFNYTPVEWLYWSNNAGQEKIARIQEQFLSLKGYPGVNSGKALIDQLINKNKVWIAVDEAQVAGALFSNKTIQIAHMYDTPPAECKYSNLLHAMVFYALPAGSYRIIGGTGLESFDTIGTSGALKGSVLYELATADSLEFPFVSGDEVLAVIGQYLNLDLLSEETKAKAKRQLEGRLRYTLRILGILMQEIANTKQLQTNEDIEEFFTNALEKHAQEILDEIIKGRIKRVGDQLSMGQRRLFYSHLGSLCYKSIAGKQKFYPACLFTQLFGIAPEETGVLFFEKHQNEVNDPEIGAYSYWYTIKEKFIAELLLSNSDICRAYQLNELYDKMMQNRHASPFGLEFQEYFAFSLQRNLPEILKQVGWHKLPKWCEQLDCSGWTSFFTSKQLQKIESASKALKGKVPLNCLKKMESALKSNDKHLFAENSSKLQNYWQKNEDGLSWTQTLHQLEHANVEDALKTIGTLIRLHKNKSAGLGDALFLLFQSVKYLLSPSPSFGPDILGFATLPDGEKVLIGVSMSVRQEVPNKKWVSNIIKLIPAHFFLWEKNKKELELHNIVLDLLPKKMLMINYTAHQGAIAVKVSEDYVLIHLTDGMLAKADSLLAKSIDLITKSPVTIPKSN